MVIAETTVEQERLVDDTELMNQTPVYELPGVTSYAIETIKRDKCGCPNDDDNPYHDE